jgi:hypothetical protein
MLDYDRTLITTKVMNLFGNLEVNENRTGMKSVSKTLNFGTNSAFATRARKTTENFYRI